jgi:DNA mismatch endonuclease (patch repair protein)
MDTRSPEQRSRIMRSVKSQHTGPEVKVRSLVHALGYRFRLHQKKLAGSPDIVLARHRAVIFVNGCFWHGHNCPKGRLPKSRLDFWTSKIQHNQNRDAESIKKLKSDNWRVLTVWQCETKYPERLRYRLLRFLSRKTKRRRHPTHSE